MADYIVTSGELTTVANAIREKNGTSSNLSWPDGFVSGISSGGGGESDFSTAQVTMSADSDVEYFDLSAVITEEGPDMITIRATSLNPGDTETAVLYKGHQYIIIDSEMATVTVVSGNAEILTVQDPTYGETKYLDIKGDCTITIS